MLKLRSAVGVLAACLWVAPALADISPEELAGIQTPNTVETSIGTLNFIDGAPLPETSERLYDYLDTMRGVDAFLKGIPAASLHALIEGQASIGADQANEVVIFETLMDSASLFLTGNSNTMYVLGAADLERDGPLVVEPPLRVLGAFNDAWFRYVEDIGMAGPDRGEGGKYLLLPPGYEGDVPEGYFVVRPSTYTVWILLRAPITDGLEAARQNVYDNTRIYPLAQAENPPEMAFINGSGMSFNTIHPNTFAFYEHLNEVIQKEPLEMLDPELRGLFAAIGMEKGKPFEPDERMRAILTDAVAIANGISRSIIWYPRTDMNLAGVPFYADDPDSRWMRAIPGRDVFFRGPDGSTMNSDARLTFHYAYTVVTPAMAGVTPGAGSDYAAAFVDAAGNPFDGSKTYVLHLPPDPPVNNFWAVTLYDSQTRSMLQTSQSMPAIGSQSEGFQQNEDGSYDIYFGPAAPEGMEANWLETIAGKSFFVIIRAYGPLEPWIDQTWRPSQVTIVE